jgi:outer membrane protein OmpA-like peptidoglycan-associated protein
MVAVGIGVAAPARGQDGDSPVFDGHGPTIPPPGASDGLAVWAPAPRPAGAWSAAGVAEGVNDLLVQEAADGSLVPVLDDVVGLDLTGSWQIASRVGLAATVPIWLTSAGVDGRVGPGGGDAWIWVPIDLLRRNVDTGDGFGLAIRPGGALPTGAGGRFLGGLGPSGALALTPSVGAGLLVFAIDAGITGQGADALPAGQPVGGLRFQADALLGADLGPVRLALEGRSAGPLDRAATTAADRPVELLFTTTGRFGAAGSGVWAGAGAGRGVTRGIGAPGLRVVAGAGWIHTPESADSALPAEVDVVQVHVRAPDGTPVSGAEIRAGNRVVGSTAADGSASLRPSRATEEGIAVSAPGLGSAEAQLVGATLEVTLPWVPTPIPIRVQDQAGKPVEAAWTARSLEDPPLPPLRGTGVPSLPPGSWELVLTAPGAGEQRRVVAVVPRNIPTEVEVVLLPDGGPGGIAMHLADSEGHPVVGARVLVDGQPVGLSGARGDVALRGLAAGPHQVIVRSDVFTERQIDAVAVAEGLIDLPIGLDRVPGSVRVTVRGPDGAPATDAVLRFDGPRRLAPMPVGARGERLQVLGAGQWNLLVTSAKYGVQERAVDVPEDSFSLIGVDVVLQDLERGPSDLLVRVVDPEGTPVDHARVALDGEALGETSTGGEIVLRGLADGPRELAVEGVLHRPAARKLALVAGFQEAVLTLDWVAGATRVVVHSPTAPVRDATLRLSGPADLPAHPIGEDGLDLLQLAPGEWTVLVTSPASGLFDAAVVVTADDRRLHEVDALMLPDEGGAATLDLAVRDPDGRPVEGARVSLDGELVGITGEAGVSVDALEAGRRVLKVEAPPLLARLEQRISLAAGDNAEAVSLTWAAGTAEVQVVDSQGAPIPDAILRLAGPRSVAATPVDSSGERRFALAPGSWQVLATSTAMGFAEESFTLTGTEKLAPVRLVLDPLATGRAELLVRVQDPDGAPIPDATVTVAETPSASGSDGAALLDLEPGPTTVDVAAPGFRPAHFTLQLAGSMERIAVLPFEPVGLDVEVVDGSGQPVDAEIRLAGPEDRDPVRAGPSGAQHLDLRPGTWQVVAATDSLGPTLAEVKLARKAEKVRLVLESSKVEVTGAAVRIKEQVLFDFDRAALQPGSDAVLRQVANTILSRPAIIRVEVQGHTDDKGTVAYNQQLSQARAESVAAALVALGVPQEKILAVGYGMQRPLVRNESEEGRAANRRVVFELTEASK